MVMNLKNYYCDNGMFHQKFHLRVMTKSLSCFLSQIHLALSWSHVHPSPQHHQAPPTATPPSMSTSASPPLPKATAHSNANKPGMTSPGDTRQNNSVPIVASAIGPDSIPRASGSLDSIPRASGTASPDSVPSQVPGMGMGQLPAASKAPQGQVMSQGARDPIPILGAPMLGPPAPPYSSSGSNDAESASDGAAQQPVPFSSVYSL